MVIDLTQDSESDQAQPTTTVLSSLQHLALRFTGSQRPSNPLKRKSDRSVSEDSSDAVSKWPPRVNRAYHDSRTPTTPSSANSLSSGKQSISVVIPSPSIVQRRESTDDELIGISEKFFPIDVHEKRAAKGTYPSAKHVDRKKASLDITPHAPAAKSVKSLDSTASIQSSINAQLVKTLRAKLAVIDGPKVTVAPKDELALALAVENFQFVNSYQLRAGVKRAPESFNSGCTCGVFCNPAFCSCLELKDEQDRKISPYVRSPRDQKTFVLSPWFLNMKSKLMECNSRCGCKGSCWNAVAQSRKISLQIFHTGNRGFGLRSPDVICAGQFIDRYLGEIITSNTSAKREEAASGPDGHSYLFTLDWSDDLEDDPDFSEDESAGPYVVDGQKYGTPTRFMNHSCDPNCKIIPVSRDHGDDFIYDLSFFAVKDIPPLTELTFDYNPGWTGDNKANVDPDAVSCLCGERNCRKQLWPNTRKGTK